MGDPLGYIPVRVNTLRADAELSFDVFVYWKDRYLHYRKSKDKFEAELIRKFTSHQVKKIFIREEDEKRYLKYLDAGLDTLESNKTPINARAELAQASLQVEAENIERNLDSEASYNATQDRVDKVLDFIISDPASVREMLASAGISVDNSHHSSSLAALASALAYEADIVDTDELIAINIAAMLHDLSLAELGLEGIDPATMGKEQLVTYKTHPQKSVDRVAGKKFITPKVLRLIADHEEVGQGKGFPEKKNLSKLPVASQIFNLCDRFDHYCSFAQKPPKDAVEGFIEASLELFDEDHLEMLKDLLVAPPAKTKKK